MRTNKSLRIGCDGKRQFYRLKKIDKIRKEYQFWFERRRYDISKSLPKDEVIEVFEYIADWASQKYESDGSANKSLLVLSEQSKRIKELMEALPDAYNFLNNFSRGPPKDHSYAINLKSD